MVTIMTRFITFHEVVWKLFQAQLLYYSFRVAATAVPLQSNASSFFLIAVPGRVPRGSA